VATERKQPVDSLGPGFEALMQAIKDLREAIGGTLEDRVPDIVPWYLADYHGIHVSQLERRSFSVDGEEIEVDFYGEGEQHGQAIAVVGEVKHRVHGPDVESAVRLAERLRPHLPAVPVVVLYAFVFHPSARDAASRLGAIMVPSTGRPQRW
jgi:hypothetical protein